MTKATYAGQSLFWLVDPEGASIKSGEGMTAGSHKKPRDHIFKHTRGREWTGSRWGYKPKVHPSDILPPASEGDITSSNSAASREIAFNYLSLWGTSSFKPPPCCLKVLITFGWYNIQVWLCKYIPVVQETLESLMLGIVSHSREEVRILATAQKHFWACANQTQSWQWCLNLVRG